MRILLADHTDTRELLVDLLGSQGHDCVLVLSGAEVLLRVREYLPELVIIQQGMPGVDCLRLLDDLLALGGPAIALICGQEGDATTAEARRRGAVGCLARPVSAQRLHQLTQHVAEQRRSLAMPMTLPRLPPAELRVDPEGLDLDGWHRAMVIAALQLNRGSPVKASAYLGISRKVLYTLRKRYGLFGTEDQEVE